MNDININLTPIVSAIMEELVEPYQTFLAQLLRDGRITQEESERVRSDIQARGERLSERVRALLGR